LALLLLSVPIVVVHKPDGISVQREPVPPSGDDDAVPSDLFHIMTLPSVMIWTHRIALSIAFVWYGGLPIFKMAWHRRQAKRYLKQLVDAAAGMPFQLELANACGELPPVVTKCYQLMPCDIEGSYRFENRWPYKVIVGPISRRCAASLGFAVPPGKRCESGWCDMAWSSLSYVVSSEPKWVHISRLAASLGFAWGISPWKLENVWWTVTAVYKLEATGQAAASPAAEAACVEELVVTLP